MLKETLDNAKVISPSYLNNSGIGDTFAPPRKLGNQSISDMYKPPDPQMSNSGSKLLQMMQKHNQLPAEDEDDLFEAINRVEQSHEEECYDQFESKEKGSNKKQEYCSPR